MRAFAPSYCILSCCLGGLVLSEMEWRGMVLEKREIWRVETVVRMHCVRDKTIFHVKKKRITDCIVKEGAKGRYIWEEIEKWEENI